MGHAREEESEEGWKKELEWNRNGRAGCFASWGAREREREDERFRDNRQDVRRVTIANHNGDRKTRMTGWIDSARAALPRREDAIITGIFFSFIRHRFCGKNGWGVSSLIRWRERRNKMREGGREGGKRKRIEKRNERNVFPIFSSFFFFSSLLKYVGEKFS